MIIKWWICLFMMRFVWIWRGFLLYFIFWLEFIVSSCKLFLLCWKLSMRFLRSILLLVWIWVLWFSVRFVGICCISFEFSDWWIVCGVLWVSLIWFYVIWCGRCLLFVWRVFFWEWCVWLWRDVLLEFLMLRVFWRWGLKSDGVIGGW